MQTGESLFYFIPILVENVFSHLHSFNHTIGYFL